MDPLSRRAFLRTAGIGAAGLSLAAILAACEKSAQGTGAITRTTPIASGLPIERGATLRIFQRGEYLYDEVISSFVKRYRDYDIDAKVESFTSVDDAIAQLGRSGSDFDVFFPSIESLPPLAEAEMLRPLNHDYLPNMKNLWPFFQPPAGPSYDAGARYTTPYTVFTTGIAWRDDLVDPADAPDRLENPFDLLWNPKYRTGMYPSYREALAAALMRNGVGDPNAPTQAELDAAAGSLRELEAKNTLFHLDAVTDALPEGEIAASLAWSGDVLTARRYALDEGGEEAGNAKHLRYFWPERGVIGADLSAILSQGRNPVLAHAFLDHLMDMEVALENFGWNGYQPAVSCAVPAMFAAGSKWRWITGPDLVTAIAPMEAMTAGTMLLPLSPADDARWQAAWHSSGVTG